MDPRLELGSNSIGAIQAEILREKATSLGRAAQRLEAALAELERIRAAASTTNTPTIEQRLDEHLAIAGEALWYYVVQREACGAFRLEPVVREYRVPRQVLLRMGPRLQAP